jgi:hypothetical protein
VALGIAGGDRLRGLQIGSRPLVVARHSTKIGPREEASREVDLVAGPIQAVNRLVEVLRDRLEIGRLDLRLGKQGAAERQVDLGEGEEGTLGQIDLVQGLPGAL